MLFPGNVAIQPIQIRIDPIALPGTKIPVGLHAIDPLKDCAQLPLEPVRLFASKRSMFHAALDSLVRFIDTRTNSTTPIFTILVTPAIPITITISMLGLR